MSATQVGVKTIVGKNVHRRLLKALDSCVINSKTVYDCLRCLNKPVSRYDVRVPWVPRHKDIPRNWRAYELARRGMTIELSDDLLWTMKSCIILGHLANAFYKSCY